jgi:hypothetical protein
MASKINITETTGSVFSLLEHLSSEDRKRVINAVFALLGDSLPASATVAAPDKRSVASPSLGIEGAFGPKARQWLTNHRLTREKLDKVFYFQGEKVDVHLNTVPGAGKKEQTINCYLLVGAKAYLESDNATISDGDAIALCKHTQAYDKNNHATNRKALGNFVTGSRQDGLTLTGPGLKAAAELLVRISESAVP